MCGRKKPRSMNANKKVHDGDWLLLQSIIYDLKKQIDILQEEIQAKEIELKKIREQLEHKSNNYDELGY